MSSVLLSDKMNIPSELINKYYLEFVSDSKGGSTAQLINKYKNKERRWTFYERPPIDLDDKIITCVSVGEDASIVIGVYEIDKINYLDPRCAMYKGTSLKEYEKYYGKLVIKRDNLSNEKFEPLLELNGNLKEGTIVFGLDE